MKTNSQTQKERQDEVKEKGFFFDLTNPKHFAALLKLHAAELIYELRFESFESTEGFGCVDQNTTLEFLTMLKGIETVLTPLGTTDVNHLLFLQNEGLNQQEFFIAVLSGFYNTYLATRMNATCWK